MHFHNLNIGTDWGLPPDVEQVRFGMEIFASCDAFGFSGGYEPCGMNNAANVKVAHNRRSHNLSGIQAEYAQVIYDGTGEMDRLHRTVVDGYSHHLLFILDVAGRKVRTLVDGNKEAGFHSLVWDGLDDSGPGRNATLRDQSRHNPDTNTDLARTGSASMGFSRFMGDRPFEA